MFFSFEVAILFEFSLFTIIVLTLVDGFDARGCWLLRKLIETRSVSG